MSVRKYVYFNHFSVCVHERERDRETDKSKAELDDTQWEGIKNQYVSQRITQNILAEKQKKECCLL